MKEKIMPNNNNDKKALEVLEKAVYKAQNSLEMTQQFRPFMMIMDINGVIKTIENQAEDIEDSYNRLGDSLKERVLKEDIDVVVLAVDTNMPERFGKGTAPSIRLHIEEMSQIDTQISARFIYVPYKLYRVEKKITCKLDSPIPIGFPAEYLQKK